MTEALNATRSPLLPDRHPIQDFFICDVTDAIPKGDMGSMEHPIFSLATKPDVHIREYEHKGRFPFSPAPWAWRPFMTRMC